MQRVSKKIGDSEEVFQQLDSCFGEEAFRMKLDSVNGIRFVTKAHDLACMSGKIGPGGHFELGAERCLRYIQAVVSRRGEGIGQAGKNPGAYMVNGRNLAVH